MDVNALRAVARPDAAETAQTRQIRDTARDFEAMFLGLVVNEMMKDAMPETMNGGVGEEMFTSLMGNAIGARMAEAGGVGIAASVEEAMRAYKT